MKIEISKKILIIAVITILLLFLCSIIGFNIGFNKGYGKAVAKYENPKGDGSHFYGMF